MRIPQDASAAMSEAAKDDYINAAMHGDDSNNEESDQSDGESEEDEFDDVDSDDEDARSPEVPERYYPQNWEDFRDIRQHRDAAELNIVADGDANDLSKNSYGNNFILRERPPQDVRPKVFTKTVDDDRTITTDIDNEGPPPTEVRKAPVPPKRTNIRSSRSMQSEPKATSETHMYDNDNIHDDDTGKHSRYKQIGDISVPQRPTITGAPSLSVSNRPGSLSLISSSNQSLRGLPDPEFPVRRGSSGAYVLPAKVGDSPEDMQTENPHIYVNRAFQDDSGRAQFEQTEQQHLESTQTGQHASVEAETTEPKTSNVHWQRRSQASPDGGEQQEDEVSNVDRTNWDVFRSYRYDTSLYACEELFKVATKVIKVVFIIISFGLILTGLITSKLAVLFATSNLNLYVGFRKNNVCNITYMTNIPTKCNTTYNASTECYDIYFPGPGCNVTQFVNDDLNTTDIMDADCDATDFVTHNCNATYFMDAGCNVTNYICVGCNATDYIVDYCNTTNITNKECDKMNETAGECPYGSDVMWGVPVMYDDAEYKDRDVIRWLWCIWMCMCMPYILTFLNSMWAICFKKKRKPAWSALFIVLFVETMHTVGMVTLFYIIMPAMDVFDGLFLMNATALLPSFFKLFIRPRGDNLKEAKIFGDVVAFIFQLAPHMSYFSLIEGYSSNGTEYLPYNCSGTSDPDIYADENNYVGHEQCGYGLKQATDPALYLIPIALLLISSTWWQNYVDKHLKMKCTRGLCELSREIKRGQTKIYAAVSIWKIIISFFSMILVTNAYYGVSIDQLFGEDPNQNSSAFHDHKLVENADGAFENDWLIVFAASAISGVICYYVSVNAIQAKVQKIAYSAAIVVATPITLIFALFGFCGCGTDKSVMAGGMNIDDIYWNCFDGFPDFVELITNRPVVLVGIVWWVGQLIVTRHLWTPKSERLVKAGRIFIQPYYCGLLLEQSFALNRSRHDLHREKKRKLPRYYDSVTPGDATVKRKQTIRHKITDDRALTQEENLEDLDEVNIQDQDKQEITHTMAEDPLYDRPDKSEPMIFICATMWHENEKEMLQMIKSIIRLDRDQCHRRLARDYFRVRIKDFYNFEGHIFFDDAFNKYITGDPEFKVNRFVAMFVRIIGEAATYVHGANVVIDHPKKIPTPYGGKLVYTLPGGNLLYLHLKDKQRIRHRKRWSQVMYMYYLLGHRLWDKALPRKTKEEVAYNTYLLTLDGDVDFKPEAVLLLVDLMKRNFGVGAACGRIHPAGNGPLVWYQKFEYAISHWLQKTTEHVLGCVLCSPGCFSLFRASALMDDNIVKTYSQTAEEALHYVQYDQGEDRWLCTLLLQRGYRVEYSAAADALTYAPEGFDEFFNQRRRWTPSTFANIMDLLSTGGATAKRNQNISILYIIYQAGLMFSSVLGPATIFMMVVSSFSTVLSMEMTGAFILVLIPISIFFIICMVAKSGIQLAFAAVLGGLFAIAQMVVLVGLIVAIANDGLCSPTAWFLLGTTAIFVISGLLHPQEMFVLVYGILYFILIPTMYLLLIIYSLCNMHVVSWGTREVVQTEAEKQKLQQREIELAVKQVKTTPTTTGAAPTGVMNMFSSVFGRKMTGAGDEDGWTWSCGDACRCMCCPRPGESPTDHKITKLEKQVAMLSGQIGRVIEIESGNSSDGDSDESKPLVEKHRSSLLADNANQDHRSHETPQPDYDINDRASTSTAGQDNNREEAEKITYSEAKPYWTQDMDAVGKGPVGSLNENEEDFWKNLIRRYLQPIEQNPEREERIKKELLSLRNKVVIGFFMIDMLFITLIQTLQTIPTNTSTSENPNNNNTEPDNGYHLVFVCYDPIKEETVKQYIEPVGFAFLMVFGLFLLIQFGGMLLHRLFSLIQIVSSTVLCKNMSDDNMSYLKLTETMSKLEGDQSSLDTQSMISTSDGFDSRRPSIQTEVDDDEMDHTSGNLIGARKVMRRLQQKPKVYGTIDKIFAQRFLALDQHINNDPGSTFRANRPGTAIQRSVTSVYPPQLSSSSMNQHRPKHNLFRTKTHGQADVVHDIMKRKEKLFGSERQEALKNKFQLSDKDIQGEEHKLKQWIPEVRDFRDFRHSSYVSGRNSVNTDGVSNTYQNIEEGFA